MRSLIKDKRAQEIQIVVTVVLTIIIIGIALFNFIKKNSHNVDEVNPSGFFEITSSEEIRAKVFLYSSVKEAMKQTFNELAGQKIDNYDLMFKNKVIEKLKNEFNSLDSKDSLLVNLRSNIINDKFELGFSSNILDFTLKDYTIQIADNELKMLASRKIEISFKININEL